MMPGTQRKKHEVTFLPYSIIVGKWHGHRYVVQRKLGKGMIGSVYLCKHNERLVALKISEQPLAMMAEVNVLKSLNEVRDQSLGPYLFDVDDMVRDNGVQLSFYVMEYVQGESIHLFVRRHGYEWIGVFLIQILDKLEMLHREGWVFGDLKNDHILIDNISRTIRLIDVGGMTKIGRSIREYSEFYDRAYWGLGTRLAEPSYDLFALVMICLTIFYPAQFRKEMYSERLIIRKINNIPILNLYKKGLIKAILGQFNSAQEMKLFIIDAIVNKPDFQLEKINKKKSTWFDFICVSCLTMMNFYIGYLLLW